MSIRYVEPKSSEGSGETSAEHILDQMTEEEQLEYALNMSMQVPNDSVPIIIIFKWMVIHLNYTLDTSENLLLIILGGRRKFKSRRPLRWH